MVNFDSTLEMLKKLPDRERVFLESFVEFLEKDEKLLNKLGEFLAEKLHDIEMKEHLKSLMGEIKVQACVEYMVIGLVAGEIKTKEISTLVQEN